MRGDGFGADARCWCVFAATAVALDCCNLYPAYRGVCACVMSFIHTSLTQLGAAVECEMLQILGCSCFGAENTYTSNMSRITRMSCCSSTAVPGAPADSRTRRPGEVLVVLGGCMRETTSTNLLQQITAVVTTQQLNSSQRAVMYVQLIES